MAAWRKDRSCAPPVTSESETSCQSRSAWLGRRTTDMTRYSVLVSEPYHSIHKHPVKQASLPIAPRNHRFERADRLRLASHRSVRAVGRIPAENIEMHPALRLFDEAPEEQGGDDGAG